MNGEWMDDDGGMMDEGEREMEGTVAGGMKE